MARDVFPQNSVTFHIFSGDQTLHRVSAYRTSQKLNEYGTYNVSALVDVTALRQFNDIPTRLTCEVDYVGRGSIAKPTQPLTLAVSCKLEYIQQSDIIGVF